MRHKSVSKKLSQLLDRGGKKNKGKEKEEKKIKARSKNKIKS